jgi:hypothetical protein
MVSQCGKVFATFLKKKEEKIDFLRTISTIISTFLRKSMDLNEISSYGMVRKKNPKKHESIQMKKNCFRER